MVSPRAKIVVYLLLTFGLSALVQSYILGRIKTVYTPLTFALMWIPGVIALLCSWWFGHGQRDLGTRWPTTWTWFAVGYGVPAAAALLLVTGLILTGIGEMAFYGSAKVLRLLLVSTTMGVITAAIPAVGEEIGWRGFLHEQMKNMDTNHPYLITGAIWAVWHWPLIVFGDYATSPMSWLSVALFSIMAMAFSVFLGVLRDLSDSVWPVVLAHAAHNTWVQVIYPGFYKAGPLDPYFGGESGFGLAVIYVIVAAVIYKFWLESQRQGGGLPGGRITGRK